MNSMERVLKALNHEEADRVPVYPLWAGVTRKFVGADYKTWSTDAETCANGYIEMARRYPDIDCIVTLIDLSLECTAWGQELIYSESDAAHPNYENQVIQSVDDYGKIKHVDYRTCDRMMMHIDTCRRLVDHFGDEKPVVAFVYGPLGTLSMLRNQQKMYMDIYDDPDAVRGACMNIARTLKDYAEALCDTGVAAIMWDTLFASGSIMSKEMWDDMEGDAIQMCAEAVAAKGCMNMIHNCGGDIYFDAQIKRMHPAAISFLYPPNDCKDFAETKEKYGDQTTLIGAIPPSMAVFGSDKAFDEECMRQIDTMAADGGFMLAPGCELLNPASIPRGERMIEVAKTYGVYGEKSATEAA
ncbi:MAG: uroporphyrinogen decarboxylase family protein [Coriobacteriales bacterium]|nr:uroporphyrinogen decarboxylase family protein [Coriobacteriales bacterium]